MPVNMSTADRIIRTFLAVVIAVLYFRGQLTGILAIVLGVIAVAFLLSSFRHYQSCIPCEILMKILQHLCMVSKVRTIIMSDRVVYSI